MNGIDLKSGRNGKAPVVTLSSEYDMPVVGLPVLFGGGRYGHGALPGFVSGAGL